MKKFSYHYEISHTGSPYMTFNQFYQQNFQKIFLEFSRAKKLLRHAPIDFDRKLTSDHQTLYIFWKPTPWTLVPPSVNVVHKALPCSCLCARILSSRKGMFPNFLCSNVKEGRIQKPSKILSKPFQKPIQKPFKADLLPKVKIERQNWATHWFDEHTLNKKAHTHTL